MWPCRNAESSPLAHSLPDRSRLSSAFPGRVSPRALLTFTYDATHFLPLTWRASFFPWGPTTMATVHDEKEIHWIPVVLGTLLWAGSLTAYMCFILAKSEKLIRQIMLARAHKYLAIGISIVMICIGVWTIILASGGNRAIVPKMDQPTWKTWIVILLLFWALFPPMVLFTDFFAFDCGAVQIVIPPGTDRKEIISSTKDYVGLAAQVWAGFGVLFGVLLSQDSRGRARHGWGEEPDHHEGGTAEMDVEKTADGQGDVGCQHHERGTADMGAEAPGTDTLHHGVSIDHATEKARTVAHKTDAPGQSSGNPSTDTPVPQRLDILVQRRP